MASLASRREPGRRVDRICRALVIRLMATVTSRRQCPAVIVVYVTARARRRDVCARERKRCVVVVKRSIGPRGSVVAQITSGREARVVDGS